MNIAIYLRKSRAEELSDTVDETLKKHKDTLLDFAQKQSLNIIEIYEEVVSGENLYTRTQMLRLLTNVELGTYDAVLCMDIDRLGRGAMSQQGIILETFKLSHTKIITPRKVFDLDNEMDEEYTEFQTFFARRELKTINRRMRQGINKTIQDGGYIANAPYGYAKCRADKLPSLHPVEEEAKFVRMIFDMYVNQGYGCQIIASTISAMGAVPRRGDAFNRTTIMKILKNAVYIGKIVWNRKQHIKPKAASDKHTVVYNHPDTWLTFDGVHPPIVDFDTFERAQQIITGRYHPPSNHGQIVNPFAGLIVCSNCGGKMQRRKLSQDGSVYLLCDKKSCVKATPFNLVDDAVLQSLQNHLVRLSVDNTKSKEDTTNSELIAAQNQIERNIVEVTLQRNKLYDLLEQGVYSIEVFTQRGAALTKREKALNEALTLISQKIKACGLVDNSMLIKLLETVLEKYSISVGAEKNALLKQAVERIIYSKEKISPTDKFDLDVHLKRI